MSDSPRSTDATETRIEDAEARILHHIEKLSDDLRTLNGKIQHSRELMRWPSRKARQIQEWTSQKMTPEFLSIARPVAALAGALLFVSIWQRRYPLNKRSSQFSTYC